MENSKQFFQPSPPQRIDHQILSLKDTLELMAKRPGITTGGGIEQNTPNPDPKAAEPPTTEDDILATYRITAWEEQNKAIRRLQDNVRKKVSAHGGHYIKPRVWTPKERAALMRWRNTYGMTPTGTGVGGRVNPQQRSQ